MKLTAAIATAILAACAAHALPIAHTEGLGEVVARSAAPLLDNGTLLLNQRDTDVAQFGQDGANETVYAQDLILARDVGESLDGTLHRRVSIPSSFKKLRSLLGMGGKQRRSGLHTPGDEVDADSSINSVERLLLNKELSASLPQALERSRSTANSVRTTSERFRNKFSRSVRNHRSASPPKPPQKTNELSWTGKLDNQVDARFSLVGKDAKGQPVIEADTVLYGRVKVPAEADGTSDYKGEFEVLDRD